MVQSASEGLLRSLYSSKLEAGGVRPIDTIGIERLGTALEAIIDPTKLPLS